MQLSLISFRCAPPQVLVFTCQRGPRRAQDADSYLFLRVFLVSDRGPRRAKEADSYVFYNVFLACGPHHTCFTVSAVVAASVWRRLAWVRRHGYFLHAGGLLAGSYGKTHIASDGAETASV